MEERIKENTMILISNVYGLQPGELFRIEFNPERGVTDYIYMFTEKGLLHQHISDYEQNKNYWHPAPADFLAILGGAATVVKTNIKENVTEPCGEHYPKPPLGIPPYSIFRGKRIGNIFAAMRRYSKEKVEIPVEWINELEKYVVELDVERERLTER